MDHNATEAPDRTSATYAQAWRFPAEADAVARARREVIGALSAQGCDARLTDAAQLVTSELATNAILHAQTPWSLTLEIDRHLVRLTVRDDSPVFPAVRHYGTAAATGRGLGIVAGTAASWGAQREGAGKRVWAELTGLHFGSPADPVTDTGPTPAAAAHRDTVLLRRVPVQAYLSMQAHNDELYQELSLLADRPGSGKPTDAETRRLADDLTTTRRLWMTQQEAFRTQVSRARAEGSEATDLRAAMDAEDVAHLRRLVALLDQADALCRRGALLTEAPVAGVAEMRQLLATEIERQVLDGLAPSPWPGTPDR